MALIYETASFRIEAPDRPHIDREDGGHVIISPIQSVGSRQDLSVEQSYELMRLTVIVGRAMTDVMNRHGVDIGNINYQDNNNWDVFGGLHIHLYGRAKSARVQKYGQACKFPRPDDQPEFYEGLRPLEDRDNAAIGSEIERLLLAERLLRKRHRYEELLPHEFFAELDRVPVAWVPCGLLEWHGNQSALGLDGLKVHELCLRAAERAGGVVLPATWFGPGGAPPKTRSELKENLGVYASMAFDRDMCKSMFVDLFDGLERVGFKAIIALGGHYPSGNMLENVAADYMEESDVRVWAGDERKLIKDHGGSGDHGGKWETSFLWHLRPELVDFSHFEDDCGGRIANPMDRLTNDPKDASPEFGQKWMTLATDRLVEIAGDLAS